jgi:hypothetical protein
MESFLDVVLLRPYVGVGLIRHLAVEPSAMLRFEIDAKNKPPQENSPTQRVSFNFPGLTRHKRGTSRSQFRAAPR